MSDVRIGKVSYGGWGNCVQLVNDIVDLIVTADVGPRIIRYGFAGQQNEMCEIEYPNGPAEEDEWRLYGGHRLWHSPESRARTYEPDNSPVLWERITNGIKTIQKIESSTGIQKEMDITLSSQSSGVRILHRLINKGVWPVELSVWGITAMATGGKEVVPLLAGDTGLLPNRAIALWPYTRLNDPRIHFGTNCLILNQNPDIRHPLKLGISNESGWAAYFNHNHLFVKYHKHIESASYPDFGMSYETYISDFMLEMETLSPLVTLKPGDYVEHIENWELFDQIEMPGDDEAEIETVLAERIKKNSGGIKFAT